MPSKHSQIVHVTPSYPPALGGLEKVVQCLATQQAIEGSEVSVITSQPKNTDVKAANDNFHVSRLRNFAIASTTIMPALLFALLKVRKSAVVHLHVTQAFTPEMVWLASKVKRFRYIAHIHLDVPPSTKFGFLLKLYKPLLLKRVLKKAAAVVVFTQDQRKELHEKYDVPFSRIHVIANGVGKEFYYDKPRTMASKPRLLFVGRLGYQKNLPLLLETLQGVSDKFETTLVGDGELKDELQVLVKKLDVSNVTFAGRADGQKLLDYYRKADIFVLSSEREGMPLVLLEAMAMGLPIVATNVTGSRDVVKDGKNGHLVPFNDIDAFRQALLNISADSQQYVTLSQTSRKLASYYTWARVSTRFRKLYKESHA